MAKFIKIQETRYTKSIIKKYRPLNKKSLVIYFNYSRYKVENEIIHFKSERERNEIINELDMHFLQN